MGACCAKPQRVVAGYAKPRPPADGRTDIRDIAHPAYRDDVVVPGRPLFAIPLEGISGNPTMVWEIPWGGLFPDNQYPNGVYWAMASIGFWSPRQRAYVNSNHLMPSPSGNSPDNVAPSAKSLLSFILTSRLLCSAAGAGRITRRSSDD